MACPGFDQLDDLVGGDVSGAERAELIAHVKGCAACQKEARALLVIYSGMYAATSPACPSTETLASFAQNVVSSDERQSIESHLEGCEHCQSWLELFAAAESVDSVVAAVPDALDQRVAQRALSALMPDRQDLFDTLWQRVSQFARSLLDTRLEDWPSLRQAPAAAGALGFSGTPDPSVVSAAIILATTAGVAQRLALGELAAREDVVRDASQSLATRLGAGSELARRLGQTTPAILLE